MLATAAAWVYLVELAVGGGCLVAAVGAFRDGLKLVGALLLLASIAAVVHAVAALAG